MNRALPPRGGRTRDLAQRLFPWQVPAALGLEASQAREHWLLGGEAVGPESITESRSAWYVQRPDAVSAGLTRYSKALRLLGLAGPARC